MQSGKGNIRVPPSLAADGGYASAAVLPLSADGAVLGVLSFHFTAPVNFDEEYRALLRRLRSTAAQALDRARLYERPTRTGQAESANRSKDDFLSTVSHELRTPLNAMLGWAAMLRSGARAVRPRAPWRRFSTTRRGRDLIEELLDVSRSSPAGHRSISGIGPGENIRGAAEAIMPLAEAKARRSNSAAAAGVPVVPILAGSSRSFSISSPTR